MQKIGPLTALRLPEEILETIDKIAKRHGMTRSEVMRIFLETGLDTYQVVAKTGAFRVADGLQSMKTYFSRTLGQITGQQKLFG